MKLCAIQPQMLDSIDANVTEITRWIHRAADVDADVVVFPEMMLTGYDHHLHGFFKDPGWQAQVDEALNSEAWSTWPDPACFLDCHILSAKGISTR